jgi:hypothetical protein
VEAVSHGEPVEGALRRSEVKICVVVDAVDAEGVCEG